MSRKWVVLGAAVTTMMATLIGCAPPDEGDEEMGASSDAVTETPVGQCSGDGNLREAPSTSSAIAASVGGSKVNVYCQTRGQAPQPGWSETWIGVNLRQGYALRYMHVSTLACGGDVDLQGLRDCSTPTDDASTSNGSAPTGSAPAATTTLHDTKSAPGGAFSASVHVGRTAPGTVSVSGQWTAYDASGRVVGRNVCTAAPALYRDSFTGPFSCHGDAFGATRFEITYTATSPGTLSR
ncbi:MAG: hypothetical protein KF795_09585 [Labilithrix sp.]|nr:hypothetical protein [Labilithrix sp.]